MIYDRALTEALRMASLRCGRLPPLVHILLFPAACPVCAPRRPSWLELQARRDQEAKARRKQQKKRLATSRDKDAEQGTRETAAVLQMLRKESRCGLHQHQH